MGNLKLSTISIYPIKSLRGHDIEACAVERMGLKNDRRLMVVDQQGMFQTQREHARMALIKPILNAGMMTLCADGMDDLTIEVREHGQRMMVEIWDSTGVESIDQGNPAAEWLSDFLKMPTRLVRIADDYQRKVSPEYALQSDDQVGFADGFPLLIISQESLDELNSRLEQPIPMNRFRPNIVVSGTTPFAEDNWKQIRVGTVEMALVKPCARCNVPTINQDTALKGKEPNTTLATYRKINGKVMFGVNIIPITIGNLKVGDEVEILA
jgi:hypothetical protein